MIVEIFSLRSCIRRHDVSIEALLLNTALVAILPSIRPKPPLFAGVTFLLSVGLTKFEFPRVTAVLLVPGNPTNGHEAPDLLFVAPLP
ncbi:hypothetical protein AYM40_03355 [Paraburkholderia phytofirmans OLGA172]|uniref:Uncharacterized protein n=1 Tax=Paraburkholderia phytofirmans OLGA172 TaxID=1417228 RepID=A0A160FH94_9BURK|nr:hypothetical protein AYM40_03355 [Paraburkholderia phytofirmans OLGA172]